MLQRKLKSQCKKTSLVHFAKHFGNLLVKTQLWDSIQYLLLQQLQLQTSRERRLQQKSYTVPHIPICAHTIKAYLSLFWSLTQTRSTCKVSFSQDRICMDDCHECPPQLCHRMISIKKRIYVFPLSLAAMACNYVASKLLEPFVFPHAAKWNHTVSPCWWRPWGTSSNLDSWRCPGGWRALATCQSPRPSAGRYLSFGS